MNNYSLLFNFNLVQNLYHIYGVNFKNVTDVTDYIYTATYRDLLVKKMDL